MTASQESAPFEISVHVGPNTQLLRLRVLPSDHIAAIKTTIQQRTSIPLEDQRLFYIQDEQIELKDWNTLEHYGILSTTNLSMHRRGLEIFVKMPGQTPFPLRVSSDDRPIDVKARIALEKGICRADQQLIFRGKVLDDDQWPSFSDFDRESPLILTIPAAVRARGQILIHVCYDERAIWMTLEVDPNERIEEIRRKIAGEGLSVPEGGLTFSGQFLADSDTLRSRGITDGSALDVHHHSDYYGQIFVKVLDGRHVTFHAGQSDRVEDLKKFIRRREGLSLREQRLIFAGQQLEDGTKLTDYKIRKDSTLHLVLRLCA
jgi:ubiquitin C